MLIGNLHDRCQLFINNGSARFVDEAASRGLTHDSSGWGASFGDFDRDGWLDLYIGNRFVENVPGQPEDNILYRNNGDGTFVDVTAAAGVAYPGAASFFGLFFDYNEDGWPDLYVCNDKGRSYQPNDLFLNRRDGTFGRVGRQVGARDVMDGMGADFVDAFNDGGMDLFVSDLPPDHLFRVWDARGFFTDEALTFGLEGGYVGWATHYLDLDNDGWQDLHVVHMDGPNHLYRNPGRPRQQAVRWLEIGDALAPTEAQTSALIGDFDNDGRVDVLHRMLSFPGPPASTGVILHRNVSAAGRWLKLRLVGTVSNRDGFGARVTVTTAGGLRQRQHARHGVGFFCGNDPRLHFGLGSAAECDIEIVWPSGQEQRISNVAADQVLTVIEPEMQLIGEASVGGACLLDLRSPSDAGLDYVIMLAFAAAPATPLPDGRLLPLALDELAAATLSPGNGVLHGNAASLQAGGWGQALLTLPDLPSIRGIRLYATGITYDPGVSIGTVFPAALAIDVR